MERLLCIVGGMNTGGAETFLMKIYRQLDKTMYQMDFCVGEEKKCFYDDEIIKLGGKIIHITKKSKNPIKSFFDIKRAVKKGNYKSVIRISQHSMSSIDLLAAKMGGAKKLIFRSSNSNSCGSFINRLMHLIFKPLAILVPTVKIAPSDKAAIHMFGKRQYKNGSVLMLNNGLNIEKYKYNDNIRKLKRKELKIKENEFVIGHVGRMTKQKNHFFLIDIFCEYLKRNHNSKLLLIGDGELKDEIIQYINKKNIKKNVIMLGVREDVNELYQAMDCVILPSLYEGMPNTVIEAQTSGLNCVISNSITNMVNLTGKVAFCDLNNINDWIKKIKKSENRENDYLAIIKKGYSDSSVCDEFVKYIF